MAGETGAANAPDAPAETVSKADYDAKVAELEGVANTAAAARDTALRQSHALTAVLGAHNIQHTPTTEALAALQVNDGKVVGDYAYTPPAPPRTTPAATSPATGTSTALYTRAELNKMSAQDVNKNWDRVSKSLAALGA